MTCYDFQSGDGCGASGGSTQTLPAAVLLCHGAEQCGVAGKGTIQQHGSAQPAPQTQLKLEPKPSANITLHLPQPHTQTPPPAKESPLTADYTSG